MYRATLKKMTNKNPQEKTTIIIFGITGDLAQKKILPALFDLYKTERLANDTQIVGFSRRPFSDGEIREFVKNMLPDEPLRHAFLDTITYVQGEFDESGAYSRLGDHLSRLDQKFHDGCSNKLFYLSVPPTLYENIVRQISHSGLSIPCGGTEGFARILVEKPFGKDLNTAEELDLLFGKLFKEEQIFRIDHYLAKSALNEMLEKRRSDFSLASQWNAKHIAHVEINLFETAVVGNRGSFYDGVGALRDVGQNHMLQMLALVAMKIPETSDPKEIQKSRAEILQSLIPLGKIDIEQSRRGQYAGYLSEPGVAADSHTETFFSLTAHVRSGDLAGVPFVLSSGKGLSKNLTEIKIFMKDGKEIVFDIPAENSLPAYQKILLDCIAGDQTVFTSTAEVLAEWKFISPIVTGWQENKPFIYPIGSDPSTFRL